MSDSAFNLSLQEPHNEDTEVVKYHTSLFTLDGKVDEKYSRLNYIEDIFGRYHLKDDPSAKIEASAKLFQLYKLGESEFISKLEYEVKPYEELFSNFINYLWRVFMSKVDTSMTVFEISNSVGNFKIYKSIHEEIKKAKQRRDIMYWPNTTEEYLKALDF